MAQATQHEKENLLESRQTARSTASDSFAVVDTGEAAHVPAEKHTRMAGMHRPPPSLWRKVARAASAHPPGQPVLPSVSAQRLHAPDDQLAFNSSVRARPGHKLQDQVSRALSRWQMRSVCGFGVRARMITANMRAPRRCRRPGARIIFRLGSGCRALSSTLCGQVVVVTSEA